MSDEGHANAGEAVVALAAEYGTEVVFGVVSIHNQPIVDAVVHGARFVPMRHEAAAVNAADAYARITGGLGIAVTSTGTGAGNAAGSLVEALTAGSPVLHVTGQIDSPFLGRGLGVIHETKDQRGMLDAVSKRAFTVVDADETAPSLWTAARVATSVPRGPTSVEIAIDVQYRPGRSAVRATASAPAAVDDASIACAAELLREARRPALWLGGGAVGAAGPIRELVEQTGAAVFTSNAGRGTLDERHPQVIGNFASSVEGQRLLDDADLLLSIGTHFRSNETRHYHLRLPAPHIQVDVDPSALGRAYPADVTVVGEAGDVVAHLLEHGRAIGPDAGWRERISWTRDAVRSQLRADIGPYAELCDAIRGVLPSDSPLVRDVTIPASAWGNRLLDVHDPATNINARGGGIGQGLAMALGAALARPSVPTLAMIGDGGLAVHLGELAAVAQEQPWLVVLLFNDGGYGVLRNLQDEHFGRRAGVDLTTPDFELLARSVGIHHRLLSRADESASVLAEAVVLRAPVIVEVDCGSFGPMPKAFVPPVPVK